MLTRTVTEHFASFEAERNPLEDVRVFVQNALLETTLEKKAIAGLMLAVEEAVTNILRHGYIYGPGRIRVRVRGSKHWVSIILRDSGRAYSIDTEGSPDAQNLVNTGRRGGLGVYLMRKVTDRLDYRREGDENILTLSKCTRAMGRDSASRSSLRRRVAWVGSLAVTAFVVIGAWLYQGQSETRIRSSFSEQWVQFGRTAAAAASQHILNDRSDAEFDQLVVGLKAAHPGVGYLIILSDVDLSGQGAGWRIRAHSEEPERVHDSYEPPDGVPPGGEGRWLLPSAAGDEFFFGQHVRIDDRTVGSVVWSVPEENLTSRVASERNRIIQWAAVALIGGWLLVILSSIWMARPILKLAEIMQSARERGNEPPNGKAEPEEVREIMAAFRDATDSVARSERQLAERDLARREIEASRQLQHALLPEHLPNLPGYEFAATCRMARQVGGDYYDVIALDENKWLVIVADVAGKGLPAALVMTAIRTATRLLAPLNPSPKSLLAALHNYLIEHHPSGPFVTACCIVIDTRAHTVDIASAGHTPAIHYRIDDLNIRRINPRGRPIGVPGGDNGDFADRLEHETINVQVGDRLVLFTDGLTDTRNPAGDSYGNQRLEASLIRAAREPAERLISEILNDSEKFSEGASAMDDLTILAIARTAQSGSEANVSHVENAPQYHPETIS